MLRELAIISTVGVLCSCSDPVPPSPRAALEITVQALDATCPATHPTLSVGDEINAIRSNGGGERAINGKDSASISCGVVKTDSGFSISGKLKANTVQENPDSRQPYSQRFEITANFPDFEPGVGGKAEIFSNDTYTQRSYSDADCELTIKSLGDDNEGGAIWATFLCKNLTDPNTPGSKCRLDGTLVFENCDK